MVSRGAIVTDYRTLKAMERRGFIVAKDGHGTHWSGVTVRNYFVNEGPALHNWFDVFTYNGVDYRLRYVDGCFYPFVHRLDTPGPAFV
jgi:hypothetical protein